MGEIVEELEGLGYVERRPDPTDRRAKLIVLTPQGHDAVDAGEWAVTGLEEQLDEILGVDGAEQLRSMLRQILATG